ncbi:MAG: hypothetical protein AAGG01_08680, partial [Planctomycetota bacterium]
MKSVPSTLVLGLLVSLGIASCGSAPKAKVDNALLAKASAESRSSVAAARSERDLAGDELAIASAEVDHAKDEVKMAKLSLEGAEKGAEQTELATEIAEADGSPDQLKKAATKHTKALALVDVAREVLAVEKRELELSKDEQALAEETLELRLAQVEEAKAIAVQDLDLVEVREIPLAKIREEVATQQRKVEVATQRIEEAKKRLKEANEKYRKASAHARAVGVEDPMLSPAEVTEPAKKIERSLEEAAAAAREVA